MEKLQKRKYSLRQSKEESDLCFHFKKAASLTFKREESIWPSPLGTASKMSLRKVIEVGSGDQNSHKWRISLSEDVYDSFIAHNHSTDVAQKVFSEGSLFSPQLFGKFFDPADAFPLWEFESESLLLRLQNSSRSSTVDWFETKSEYALKAELPVGARKCELEVCNQKVKVIEISGSRRGRENDTNDWKLDRWWEYGYVRRLELPKDAKLEKYGSLH
ncbi:22.3 kDa class VI heat shock protein-like [Canna indica]|uniref:22.3 kDa class VI heat shock protein-like n=1 Tax=Canna indica TaxID=4628 RepID=A0AAQ3JL18_9LILI|nr:22.3 kDa class VI heat shock protein-like [Canna indica]